MQRENINSTLVFSSYNNAIKKLDHLTSSLNMDEQPVQFVNEFTSLEPAPYDEETFECPDELCDIIFKATKIPTHKLSEYKNIITDVLWHSGKYKMLEKHKQYCLSFFHELLAKDSLIIQNNTANYNTLRDTAKTLYKNEF
jgi:hypothetical protein